MKTVSIILILIKRIPYYVTLDSKASFLQRSEMLIPGYATFIRLCC